MKLNPKPSLWPVERRHASSMKAHSSFRDSQSQPDSPREAAAIIVDTVERQEQLFQSVERNATTAIADLYYGFLSADGFDVLQANLHSCTLTGITNGVAHHVFDRAVQQRCLSAHAPIPVGNMTAHMAMPRLRFEFRIFRHTEHHFVERNQRRRNLLFPVFKPCQSQQPANQFVETAGLEFDALEHGRTFRSRTLPRQAQSDVQARERRAELVR